MKKILEKVYLGFIRKNIFRALFFLTQNIRKKVLKRKEVKEILIFGLNRLGDNVLSIPALKAIRNSFPEAKIVIISNRYVKDVLLVDNSVTEILFYRNENIFGKLKTIVKISGCKWDLAIDFTCDYTFSPAFILFISGAKFRIGYNIEERGFLFNRPVNWGIEKKHFVDRLSDILKKIGIEILDKKASLALTEDSRKFADDFLTTNGVFENDVLVGIHPGGHYPSQRWPVENFAEIADRIVKEYNAKVIIMVGRRERQLLEATSNLMKEMAIKAYNFPILQSMGLIARCSILMCNNSGILHLACALNVPTISTMGPTD